MWFKIEGQKFIGKKIVQNGNLCIFASDLKHVWNKYLSDNELLKISQTFNPLFEAPFSTLKDMVVHLFEEDENVKRELASDNYNVVLKLHTKKMNVKFQFQVALHRGDEELLYEEFTMPLILTVLEMQSREKKLIDIINQKDLEIEEYKQENPSYSKGFVKKKKTTEKEAETGETLSSQFNNMEPGFIQLLDCITLKLCCPKETDSVNERQFQPVINIDKKLNDKFDNKQIVLNEVSDSQSIKQCVNVNYQIVKKRKKFNKIL